MILILSSQSTKMTVFFLSASVTWGKYGSFSHREVGWWAGQFQMCRDNFFS